MKENKKEATLYFSKCNNLTNVRILTAKRTDSIRNLLNIVFTGMSMAS